MTINSSQGAVLLEVEVDDSSYRFRELMGKDEVSLSFSLADYVNIPVGSYIVFETVRYTLLTPTSIKINHRHDYEYNIVFEASSGEMRKYRVHNMVDGRLKFDLVATPAEHLTLLADNLNERSAEGWFPYSAIDDAPKLISYNHTTCAEALQLIAEAFNTEYEFIDHIIFLGKVEYGLSSPVEISYGTNLVSGVNRTNYDDRLPIGRLYVQGGDTNIDSSTYGTTVDGEFYHSSNLLLPRSTRVAFDGEYFEGEEGFVPAKAVAFVTDQWGYSVAIEGTANDCEDSLELTEIYPKRIGVVGQVLYWHRSLRQYVAKNAITDWTKIQVHIVDSNPDYDPCPNYERYLIKGETMTLIMQDGMLAGREFEVKYVHEAMSGKQGRRFELASDTFDGIEMPNGNFLPEAEQTFVVFHCMLPEEYIADDESKTGAEYEMLRKAVEYLYDNREEKFNFKGELNGVWAKQNWTRLNLGNRLKVGGYVAFYDAVLMSTRTNIRIVSVKQPINNPMSPVIEFSNDPVGGGVSSRLAELEGESAHIDELHKTAIHYTKRSFNTAKETMAALEGAVEGFTGGIQPVTVQTMMMLVGDEALQFKLYYDSSLLTPIANDEVVTYATDPETVVVAGGYLKHFTLGITDIRPNASRPNSDYKVWEMQEGRFSLSDEQADTPYYIYAQCVEGADTATYALSQSKLPLEDSELGGYNLLVGILNKRVEGSRSFAPMFGFTEVLPSQITTDKITCADGTTYLNLADGTFSWANGKLVWNGSQLYIKGSILQDDSGDEIVVANYRGTYSASATYNKNDVVSHAVGGVTQLYFHYNSTPSTGVSPTNTTYWRLYVSGGSKGNDGVGITNTQVLYATTESEFLDEYMDDGGDGEGVVVTEVVWYESLDDVPINEGWWLWTKTTFFYSDGDMREALQKFRVPVNGTVITDVIVEYGESNSASTMPSIWVRDAKAINPVAGHWLWTRTTTMYSNRDPEVSYTKARQGSNGASPVFRGDWSPTVTYYGNETRADVVRAADGIYYILSTAVGESTGDDPIGTSGIWMNFGAQFSSVATDLLISDSAAINNLTVNQVKTAPDANDAADKSRIIIVGNKLAMEDNEGNLKLSVSGSDLADLPSSSSFNNTGSSRSLPDQAFEAGDVILELVRTQALNVESEANIVSIPSFNITAGFTSESGSEAEYDLAVEAWYELDGRRIGGAAGGGMYKNASREVNNATLTIPTLQMSMTKGAHTLAVKVKIQCVTSSGSAMASFNASIGAFSGVILYTSQLVEIAKNGIRAMFGSNYMASFKQTTGGVDLTLLANNYGVKVTASGVYFKLGGTWYEGYYGSNRMNLRTASISD